jgi:RNA polymerase sigma-70 factor (ECF subfamily)
MRPAIYCVLPGDLGPALYDALRRFYRDEPSVRVIVERRGEDRRRSAERRAGRGKAPDAERRRIRGEAGRRIASRRATSFATAPRPLPRRARRYEDRILFIHRVEPSTAFAEDADTDRLVARAQAGEPVFGELYYRHFNRVFGYLRLALRDYHAAEDTTQQVFIRALEKIGEYELRAEMPFRAWLLGIARYESLNYIRKHRRTDVIAPEELDRRIDSGLSHFDTTLLDALSNSELQEYVGRMPPGQRQVLALRYILGFRFVEIAAALGRTPEAIRQLHHRALVYLEERLTASGVLSNTRRERAPARVVVRQSVALRTRRFGLTRSLGAPALGRRAMA